MKYIYCVGVKNTKEIGKVATPVKISINNNLKGWVGNGGYDDLFVVENWNMARQIATGWNADFVKNGSQRGNS